MRRSVWLILVSVLFPSSFAHADGDTTTALDRYVAKPDAAYRWEILGRHKTAGGTVFDVELTSQKWKDILWKHQLLVCVPEGDYARDTALLFIVGGSNGSRVALEETVVGLLLARLAKAPCAVLRQVPNQPLLGGHKEDSLIAETFVKYMTGGDEEWPLLLPMVKSAVRAMDATQEILAQEQLAQVQKFVVTGASKRGWTTWLTAAVDKRVRAIAPLVIDTLNFYKQLPNQLRIWGRYSEQIRDYTERGLTEQLQTPRGRRLTRIVDPFSYRNRYTIPKLIVNGTNDRYWVLDALNNYWDELPEPKYALYLPNAGHGLEQHRDYAVTAVAALVRHVATGKPLPRLTWQFTYEEPELRLTVSADQPILRATLWSAFVEGLDFREAVWSPRAMEQQGDVWVGSVRRREGLNGAAFADLEFQMDDLRYHLSTLIHRIPPLEKAADQSN